jgi:uncharacterized protein (UPF0335 family)
MKKQTTKKAGIKTTREKRPDNSNLEVLREFYPNLKKAVADTGLSAYALAKKLGFDPQVISNLVRGDRDPKLSTVVRIVKGMQVSMDALLGLVPGKKSTVPESQPVLPAQSPPSVSGTTIKNGNIDLINQIARMPENDVELMKAIADVLTERRSHVMAKLLYAMQKSGKKGDLTAKTSELAGKLEAQEDLSPGGCFDDDFDEDFGEDDDLDDTDDFDDFDDDDDDDDDFDDDD